jgi:phosphoserine phosphatase
VSRLILVSVTGPDRPGILATLTESLATSGYRLVDIQQATLLTFLGLSVLVEAPPGEGDPASRLLRSVGGLALSLGLSIEAREATDARLPGGRDLQVLTVLSDGLETPIVARLARAIQEHGANVVTIHRLAEADLSAVDFILDVSATPDLRALKAALLLLSDETGVDLGLQPENAWRKSKRLVVFDVDSTLTATEAIDELAKAAGQAEAVAKVTRVAMDGGIDFVEALTRRVALLAGLPVEVLERLAREQPMTSGAEETVRILKALGYRVGAISGGFEEMVLPLARRLGLDHVRANRLEVRDGRLTGRLEGPVIDAAGKAERLRAIAAAEQIPLELVVGVGDGANDIPMLQAAGLGIAFGTRGGPRRAAHGAIRRNDLRGVLYLLGVTDRDVRALDPGRRTLDAPS